MSAPSNTEGYDHWPPPPQITSRAAVRNLQVLLLRPNYINEPARSRHCPRIRLPTRRHPLAYQHNELWHSDAGKSAPAATCSNHLLPDGLATCQLSNMSNIIHNQRRCLPTLWSWTSLIRSSLTDRRMCLTQPDGCVQCTCSINTHTHATGERMDIWMNFLTDRWMNCEATWEDQSLSRLQGRLFLAIKARSCPAMGRSHLLVARDVRTSQEIPPGRSESPLISTASKHLRRV